MQNNNSFVHVPIGKEETFNLNNVIDAFKFEKRK